MKVNIIMRLYVVSACCLHVVIFGNCQKETIDEVESIKSLSTNENHVKLNNADELRDLLLEVNSMSDTEYRSWVEKNKINTLYDRFIQTEKNIRFSGSSYNLSEKDSMFFVIRGGHLDSKNGLLMDRILNEEGLIQIGDNILRFPQNNEILSNQRSSIESVKNLAQTIQYAEYVNFMQLGKDQKGPNRTLTDSYIKKIQIAELSNGGIVELSIHYTFYIQP